MTLEKSIHNQSIEEILTQALEKGWWLNVEGEEGTFLVSAEEANAGYEELAPGEAFQIYEIYSSNPESVAKVQLYSKPNCMQCDMTKKYLDTNNISYEIFDVTEDSTALSTVKDLGYLAAPVVVAGEKHWSGFRPDLLQGLDRKKYALTKITLPLGSATMSKVESDVVAEINKRVDSLVSAGRLSGGVAEEIKENNVNAKDLENLDEHLSKTLENEPPYIREYLTSVPGQALGRGAAKTWKDAAPAGSKPLNVDLSHPPKSFTLTPTSY